MGIGEILDAAIRLYRSQWRAVLGISAALLVPVIVVQTFLTRSFGSPFAAPSELDPNALQGAADASIVLAAIQLLFVQPLLTAAIARASADAYLGHPVSIGSTVRFALTKIHSILWISILYGIAVALGFLALIVPGVILLIRLRFGSAILIVEQRKGSKALGRSWRLTQGHVWRVLGTLFVASLLASIVAAIVSIPANLAWAAIGPQGWPIAAIGTSIASVLTTPFAMLVTVLLYFDLRIRREALDLEVMAQEIAAAP